MTRNWHFCRESCSSKGNFAGSLLCYKNTTRRHCQEDRGGHQSGTCNKYCKWNNTKHVITAEESEQDCFTQRRGKMSHLSGVWSVTRTLLAGVQGRLNWKIKLNA